MSEYGVKENSKIYVKHHNEPVTEMNLSKIYDEVLKDIKKSRPNDHFALPQSVDIQVDYFNPSPHSKSLEY